MKIKVIGVLLWLVLVYSFNGNAAYALQATETKLSGYSVKALSIVVNDLVKEKEDPADFDFTVESGADGIVISIGKAFDESTRSYETGGRQYLISPHGDRLIKVKYGK